MSRQATIVEPKPPAVIEEEPDEFKVGPMRQKRDVIHQKRDRESTVIKDTPVKETVNERFIKEAEIKETPIKKPERQFVIDTTPVNKISENPFLKFDSSPDKKGISPPNKNLASARKFQSTASLPWKKAESDAFLKKPEDTKEGLYSYRSSWLQPEEVKTPASDNQTPRDRYSVDMTEPTTIPAYNPSQGEGAKAFGVTLRKPQVISASVNVNKGMFGPHMLKKIDSPFLKNAIAESEK